jgi:Flp pilus assembly protein protease CpaA
MTVFEPFLFPSFGLIGCLLAVLYSLAIPLLLCFRYEGRYSFSPKEKGFMVLLSLFFMIVGTLWAKGPIPLPVWAFLAYHFMTDLKYMELSNGVNLWIAGLSVFSLLPAWLEAGFWGSGVPTAIVLFLVMILMGCLGPLGGGDIKMMTALGLYFTLWEIPGLLFYGCLIGSVQGLYLILVKRVSRHASFAFGPSLILGTLITVCC